MKLEDQVCSLELAKRLKEFGVKQESLFYWDYHSEDCYAIKFAPYSCPGLERYSAFTVAELGELLPGLIKINGDRLFITMDCDLVPYYSPMNQLTELYSKNSKEEDSEADSRAKMLINLIENGLIKNEH